MSKSPLRRWFLDHPASVNESYVEHFGVASRFGLTMIGGGIAALVHGIVPSLCTRTASRAVKQLYSEMVARQPGGTRPAYEDAQWRPEYEI
ncbi:DUF6356 family protein [Sphingomonas sp. RS2018]